MVRFLGKWRKATAHVRRLTLQRRADLAEFIRVQKEQDQLILQLRCSNYGLQEANKRKQQEALRAEESADAEIARLRQEIEAEKTFYAYHMADAERSREESKQLRLRLEWEGEFAVKDRNEIARLSEKVQKQSGELSKLYRESAFLIILSIGLGVSLVVALILLVMSAQ
jgi:site-specific recombinase XerD